VIVFSGLLIDNILGQHSIIISVYPSVNVGMKQASMK